jgi:hypothetical protein
METRTVRIVYGGRAVHVEYRPEAVPLDGGRELERRMREALDEDDRRELHRQALFEIMVGWDLADPGGAPVPISHEAFDRQVSWFFERLIMQSIIRHGQHGRPRRFEPRWEPGESDEARQPGGGLRPCAYCGRPFMPGSPSAKYCTAICRRRASHERERQRKESALPAEKEA